jgi:hypothetical protein
MLDWTQIIITIIASGGLTGFFLITEKKTKSALENMQKTNDEWKALCNAEREEIKILRERVSQKQQQIDDLYKEREEFMRERDAMTTELAVVKLLKCETVGCPERIPPLSQNLCSCDCSNCEK